MKKRISVLLCALLVVGFISCSNTDNKQSNNQTDSKIVTMEEAIKRYPDNTYGKINETLDDGTLMCKVTGYTTVTEYNSKDEIIKAPNESEYIIVDIDMAASKEPLEDGFYNVSDLFVIEDQEGIKYTADDSLTNIIRVKEESLDYFDTINPKIMKTMKVAFNVPKNTDPFRISINDKYNNNKWIVAYF